VSALLQADDVTFGYGDTPVLYGVSLAVPAGGLVGLIGPNGSGKTTLLRLLAGTRRPSTGRVLLDGRPIASLPRAAIARRMAVVPQETHLAFDYTVLEVALMGRYPHLGAFAIEGPVDVGVARAALAATGAAEFESRLFSTLSGGEKQRVIIAAALTQISAAAGSAAGSILLLDEPTAALDLKYQLAVAALLESLHRDRGLTIVVSTHDLSFAARLCRTLVMLKNGRVLSSGETETILTPERIRALYEVDVDVIRDAAGGFAIAPRGSGLVLQHPRDVERPDLAANRGGSTP
jgi:iron complex transport system ATP-binding protein